ncbi:MAG: hypothetical protein ACI9C2_001724 [Gammaproteobacteria bacterium]
MYESGARSLASSAKIERSFCDRSLGGYTAPMTSLKIFGTALLAFASVACQSTPNAGSTAAANETQRINAFFEEVFAAGLARNPMRMTSMGMDERNGEWADFSDAESDLQFAITVENLEHMRSSFDFDQLDEDARLSYRLFEYNAELSIEGRRWRHHGYPVHQMWGGHTAGPNLLLNVHKVTNLQQADAYVQRLEGLGVLLGQVQENLKIRERKGVLPPRFVFPFVIQDCKNMIAGAPFDGSDRASVLLNDFTTKVIALEDLSAAKREDLLVRGEAALVDVVGPAYRELIALLEAHQELATDEDGIWKLPDGAEYYRYALRRNTTTKMDAQAVHALGLSEVARIHGEMNAIRETVGFGGSLSDFFEHLRSDPAYYYENDAEGKAAYMAEATVLIDHMRTQLPAMFNTMPQAEMEVRAVEPYREQSAGKAFYNRGAPDFSRPGVYYANLFNMGDMPKYQMEALAYHEGIPGHHMQISIAQELKDVPSFRKFGGFTAYSEGWGLYSEWLPKEMGLYQDPYSDFGRLAMELWRACRLVVDTGMHEMRWTREEAIDYLMANTPNPEGDCRKAIERYIVMPGQATAYKIGMIRIMELRQFAQAELGESFDEGMFHDVVLLSGPVPLEVLEERVRAWVAGQ